MTGGGRDGEGRGGQGKEGNVGDEPGEKERGVLRAKKTDPPPIINASRVPQKNLLRIV